MMNKKWLIGLFILAAVIFFAAQPKQITLKVGIFAGSNWDVPNGDCYHIIDEAIKVFEAQHPEIQIEYESGILKEDYSTWLATKILQGEEPDVFMVLDEDFNTLSALGALADLNNYMQKDTLFEAEDYYESALKAGQYQEHQYALPYESNPTLMFVNKSLLLKEGIAVPAGKWNLDDFYEICQKVTRDTNGDGLVDQYGCYNYSWLDSVYGHGVNLFDEDGNTCNLYQGQLKEAITFVQRLNQLNQGHIVTSEEFDMGKVAFSPMSYAQYRTYKPYPWRVKKYSTFEWDCVRMPSLDDCAHSSEVSSLLIGISSRTKYKDQAWNFLKLLTNDVDIQQQQLYYSQGIPALKTVMQSEEVISYFNQELAADSMIDLTQLNEVMENTVRKSKFKKYESALNMIDVRIREMLQNSDDLDLSLISLQKEVNKFLKEP